MLCTSALIYSDGTELDPTTQMWMEGRLWMTWGREKNKINLSLCSASQLQLSGDTRPRENKDRQTNKGLEERGCTDLGDGEGACLSPDLYQLLLSKPVVPQ